MNWSPQLIVPFFSFLFLSFQFKFVFYSHFLLNSEGKRWQLTSKACILLVTSWFMGLSCRGKFADQSHKDLIQETLLT